MDVTDLVTPETTTDWHEAELGVNEGALDGNLDLLGDLDAETDVTVHVTNSDNSLEASSLTGLSLLLDGDDLHDVVLELVIGALDELVNDLGLLDGDGVSVDLLKGLDHVVLDQSSELGLWDPLLLGRATTATWSAAVTTASTTGAKSTAALTALTTSFTSWCSFCHCNCKFFSKYLIITLTPFKRFIARSPTKQTRPFIRPN